MVSSLLSFAMGSCRNFPIHLTLLKSIRCSDLVVDEAKSLHPFTGVFVPLQKLEGCLRNTSWIRAGRQHSKAERLLNWSQCIIRLT